LHLTDLGIAKLIVDDSDFIDSSGTPGYMAPEVINNMHHNLVSDFFSIGIITYELMNGKVYLYEYRDLMQMLQGKRFAER
jgi:serine/threonine kinase 32